MLLLAHSSHQVLQGRLQAAGSLLPIQARQMLLKPAMLHLVHVVLMST
jgi:hypothetical protein